MALSPEEFVKRLDAISESDGIPYGRAHLLFDEEQKHQEAIPTRATLRCPMLSNAFFSKRLS